MTYLRRISIATLCASIALIGVTTSFSPSASAATPPDSCFAFNAGTGTITDYYNNEGNNAANPACTRDVDVPSTIGGNSVTSIGPSAFNSNQLISVTIPTSVTSIGNTAFRNNQLTSVTIANAAATMQHSSFVNNPVTSMTIGSTTYNEQTPTTEPACFLLSGSTVTDYYQASPLIARDNGVLCGRSVTIPNSVTSIGPSAFNSNQLISVTIPGSVTSIGTFAFAYNQLINLSIPISVTAIGNSAFQNNQLTTVTILSNVTSIGSWAFGYNQLSSAMFQGDISSIGDYAFYSNKLTIVSMSGDVNTIGSLAFAYNQLTTITIPNSVTTIGFGAFAVQSQWGGDLDSGTNGAPDFWSSDPVEVQSAYNEIWYVRLLTENPTNPNNLVNSIVNENWWWGDDGNANGIDDSLGGHIINPASAELQYVNNNNTSLQMSQRFTGLFGETYMNNYLVAQGPIIPIPADPENPTPTEQAAIDEALSAYYLIGDTVTIDPPTIDGYITPPTQTFVLGASDNTFNYVYTLPAGTAAAPTSGGLAATGAPLLTYIACALGMSVLGAVALLRRR